MTYQDLRHAEWALWQLGPDAEALTPPELRTALRERAVAMAGRYGEQGPSRGRAGPGSGGRRTRGTPRRAAP
ncbi:hypothetical protein GCM10022244_01040 [Streptomyces gulbargensis]|uniref:WCX domain-containing protein n=1 Tax=Streptomyces gulbargensis TaxID=364901 RepID=A0ABP7L714_9ACTN